MKKLKINNKTRFILLIIIGVILVIGCLTFIIIKLNNKNMDSNLASTKDALEHVFYYLPNDKYDNMNDMSDYCKIALVYDSKFLESNNVIYDDSGNKFKSYSLYDVLYSVKRVLGSNATLNFKPDENGDYNFLTADNCQFGNSKVYSLSFNGETNSIYSLDEIESNRNVYVKWTDEIIDENNVTLYAQALMSVKTPYGYDLYVDFDMKNLIAHYESLKQLKKSLDENYALSYTYEFHLEKNNEDYVWKSFSKNNIDQIIVN